MTLPILRRRKLRLRRDQKLSNDGLKAEVNGSSVLPEHLFQREEYREAFTEVITLHCPNMHPKRGRMTQWKPGKDWHRFGHDPGHTHMHTRAPIRIRIPSVLKVHFL